MQNSGKRKKTEASKNKLSLAMLSLFLLHRVYWKKCISSHEKRLHDIMCSKLYRKKQHLAEENPLALKWELIVSENRL